MSENISVRSIVGNFLEHSRIFYFENDGSPEMYCASADWMPRNLERRVEILFPVEETGLRKKLMHILEGELKDTVKAHVLKPDGTYDKVDKRGRLFTIPSWNSPWRPGRRPDWAKRRRTTACSYRRCTMNRIGRVILASASPRRKELLEQIGIAYETMPSGADENTEKQQPEDVVLELSLRKASDIHVRLEEKGEDGYTVIGADTVVSFQGEVMGKPKDEEDARRMLGMLQGNTHQVYTGVALCIKNGEAGSVPYFL